MTQEPNESEGVVWWVEGPATLEKCWVGFGMRLLPHEEQHKRVPLFPRAVLGAPPQSHWHRTCNAFYFVTEDIFAPSHSFQFMFTA